MLELNFLYLGIIVIVLVFMYRRNVEKMSSRGFEDRYDVIKQYLLDETDISKNDQPKPIMWLHVPYAYNARNWLSFGSRSSTEVNQPYLSLTLRSIIANCDDSFKICVIDDAAFEKLISGWSIDMTKLSDPLLKYIRQLGIANLIYQYGGMEVPISFLCFKDLLPMYISGTKSNKMFVCENINTNVTSAYNIFYPNCRFMGATKGCATLQSFIEFMQRIISSNYTAQPQFVGDFDRWVNARIDNNQISLVRGEEVGVKSDQGEPVTVETLMDTAPIDFNQHTYGIWIPADSILKRRHYEWFARLSAQQIFESNCILCKYFVIALAPDSKNGVIEPMQQHNNWVSFWKTPKVSIWGVKPIDLGNNISRESYPNY